MVLVAGCATSTAPLPSSQPAGANKGHAHTESQVAPPSGSGDYLGAWVNPLDGQSATNAQLIAETGTLESSMGSKLAFHMHYFDWKTMAAVDQDTTIQDDITSHRIPIISWHCLDDINGANLNLSQIATSPQAAQDLATIGQHLALLKSADGSSYPVIVRYFWEFKENAVNGDPANINGNNGCFSGGNSSLYPSQFINAWQKIYSTLGGLLPRPNVSLDWNPNVTDSINQAAPYSTFYPGPSYVDWIGFDGYNKQDSNNNPIGFSNVFYHDLLGVTTDLSFYGVKPIVIAETGSCDQHASPNTQAQYLQTIQSTLESNTAPWSSVRAFMYYDAPGAYIIQPVKVDCNYSLNSGLSEWDTLSADPFFGATALIP